MLLTRTKLASSIVAVDGGSGATVDGGSGAVGGGTIQQDNIHHRDHAFHVTKASPSPSSSAAAAIARHHHHPGPAEAHEADDGHARDVKAQRYEVEIHQNEVDFVPPARRSNDEGNDNRRRLSLRRW